jgi:hypothetical protein
VPAGTNSTYHDRIDSGIAGFDECRDIGPPGQAFLAADRQGHELAAVDMSRRYRKASERQLHLAGQHRRHGRRDAAIRDLPDLRTGLLAQHLEQQMWLAADAVRPVIQLVRLPLRQFDQRLHRPRRDRRVGQDELVQVDQLSDRHQLLDGIEAEVLEQEGIAGDRGIRGEQQRVTVGRRAGDALGADHGAGARLVLDDDRLLPRLGQALGQRPRQVVDTAAGRIRHDQPHGPRGELLGPGA